MERELRMPSQVRDHVQFRNCSKMLTALSVAALNSMSSIGINSRCEKKTEDGFQPEVNCCPRAAFAAVAVADPITVDACAHGHIAVVRPSWLELTKGHSPLPSIHRLQRRGLSVDLRDHAELHSAFFSSQRTNCLDLKRNSPSPPVHCAVP